MSIPKSSVSAFWDRAYLAKGHTGYSDPLLHSYDQPLRLATIARILDRLFPDGLANRAALDIGCGTGDFIALLRSRRARVIAADISPAVVDRARKRFAGDSEVCFTVTSVLDLALPPASCDVITSVTVMQHLTDDAELVQALQKLRSALRPQGRMILLELAPPHSTAVPVRDGAGFVYLLERPPAQWRAAFDRAGLTIVEEPVLPQLGITLLRALSWLAGLVQSSQLQAKADRKAAVGPTGELPNTVRRAKRVVFSAARRAGLSLTWPFDHFRLPLPPAGLRHYRIFVLAAKRMPE